MFQLVRTPTD